jgi:hypothetical protein
MNLGLHTAYCRLPAALEGGRREGLFAVTASLDEMSPPAGIEETGNSQKRKERRGNVIENKGPASSTAEHGGNVIENKGS